MPRFQMQMEVEHAILFLSDAIDDFAIPDNTGSAFITDLDVAYAVTRNFALSVGANNLFDKRPHRVNAEALEIQGEVGSPAVEIYPKFTAWGINGGYYYATARLTFR